MNIGIILPHLMPSQLAFEITNIINKNISKHSYTVFCENVGSNLNGPFCPVMNISDVKYFRKGKLITFSLGAAVQALNSINHIEPLLYVYDLEWLRGKSDYVTNLKTMRSIPLATRSEQYSALVENYCNSPCPFIPLEKILCP